MADSPKVPGLTPAQQDIVNAGTANNRPVVVSSSTTPEGTTTSVGIKNPDGSLVQHTVGTNTQTGETTTQVIVKYPDNTTVGTTGTVKDGQVTNSGQIVVNPDGSRVITDKDGRTTTYPPPEKGDSGRIIIGDGEAPEQPAPNPTKKPEKPVPDKKPSEKKPPEDSPSDPSEKPEDGPSEDDPGEKGKDTGCSTGEGLPTPESSIWDDIVDFAIGFGSGVAEVLVDAAKWTLVGAAVVGTIAAGLTALGVSAATLATIGAVAGVALLVVGVAVGAYSLGQQIGKLIKNLDVLSISQIGKEIGKITTNGVLLGTAARQLGRLPGLGGKSIGTGAASFSNPKERAIAEFLEGLGLKVKPNPLEGVEGAGRQGDAIVNGIKTEFKSLDPGATPKTIKNVVNNSIRKGGQARNIVIDARGSGLSQESAASGVAKAMGISRGKVDNIVIIGDNFNIGL